MMGIERAKASKVAAAAILVLAVMIVPGMAMAASQDALAGLIWRHGMDARAIALGQACTANVRGPYGWAYNPAFLTAQEDREFAAGFVKLFYGAAAGSLGFAGPAGEFGIGLLWSGLWSGGIPGTGETPDGEPLEQGSYKASQSLLAAGIGAEFGRLLVGATAAGVFSSVGQATASGLSLDVGLASQLGDSSVVGILVKSAASMPLSWSTGAEEGLPASLRCGISTRVLDGRGLALADVWFGKAGTSLHAGFEYALADSFALRFGLDDGTAAAGAGIRHGPWSFDYAVRFGGAFDYGSPVLYTHFLTASIEF